MEHGTVEIAGRHDRSGRLLSRTLLLDLFERLCVFVLYCWFAYTSLSVFIHTFDFRALMLVISETLPVIFVTLRAPSPTLSTNLFDWIVGLLGTGFPLLVTIGNALEPLVPLQVCLALVVSGLFIEIMAKLALGKSFGLIAANRGVKSSGPYHFVRHPIYAGYMTTHVGIFLSAPSLRNALLYAISSALLLIRIQREERVLRRDERYQAFVKSVPYYLIPGVF